MAAWVGCCCVVGGVCSLLNPGVGVLVGSSRRWPVMVKQMIGMRAQSCWAVLSDNKMPFPEATYASLGGLFVGWVCNVCCWAGYVVVRWACL